MADQKEWLWIPTNRPNVLLATSVEQVDATLAELKAEFASFFSRNLIGIIVVGIHDFKVKTYWHEAGMPCSFGGTEYPVCFKIIKRAALRAAYLSQENPHCMYTLALWIHPDVDLQPLTKYLMMRHRFPGSPSQ